MTPESKSSTQAPVATVATDTTRRPYTAPTLKRLGSVRDLTLGSPKKPFTDFQGGTHNTFPM
jgi:hypothetical protein